MVKAGEFLTIDQFLPVRKFLAETHKKLVFTNGVFDILHKGHVEYLMKARNLGDAMVLALNSDASVRRIKGEKRPINPEADRAAVLCGLRCVDYVVIFNEDTPLEIISRIVPDYLVKGADWSLDKVVGREIVESAGGKVLTIELTPDRSTTNVIEKVLQVYSG